MFLSRATNTDTKNIIPQDTIYSDTCEITVPNYFRGHGDSANDQLCIYGKCIKEMNFQIYNRWGELMFESKDQKKCWDGRSKGKALPQGTYFYILKVNLITGEEKTLKGNISLLR